MGYWALVARPLTCRRTQRVHGRWSNCLEQETLDRLQFAQACSLDRSSAAGWIGVGISGGGCVANAESSVQGVSS